MIFSQNYIVIHKEKMKALVLNLESKTSLTLNEIYDIQLENYNENSFIVIREDENHEFKFSLLETNSNKEEIPLFKIRLDEDFKLLPKESIHPFHILHFPARNSISLIYKRKSTPKAKPKSNPKKPQKITSPLSLSQKNLELENYHLLKENLPKIPSLSQPQVRMSFINVRLASQIQPNVLPKPHKEVPSHPT